MSRHDLQEPLQPFPPMLDDVVAKAVGEHLPGKWGDRDTRALALQDVAEVFEVGVSAAHDGVFELEGGDVGAADDFIRGVHVSRRAVRLGIADLEGVSGLDWRVLKEGWGCGDFSRGVSIGTRTRVDGGAG